MNKVTLIGNLGKDPERRSENGPVTFPLATSEVFVKDGQKVENTNWHNIVVFGNQGDSVLQFISKGRQVAVDGSIRYRDYEKDGEKKYITEIIANRVEFLGGKPQG